MDCIFIPISTKKANFFLENYFFPGIAGNKFIFSAFGRKSKFHINLAKKRLNNKLKYYAHLPNKKVPELTKHGGPYVKTLFL